MDVLPAEGSDPAAQLRVAVWPDGVTADEQLHCVIPVSAGRVSPAGTRQGRIQLQRVKVQPACREAEVSITTMLNAAVSKSSH